MSKKQDDNREEKKTEAQVEEEVSQVVNTVTKEEFDRLESQLKRAVADYQNLEKRISEGRSELTLWTTSEIIKKLLPVVDNFERAIGGALDDDRKSGWFKGCEMALKQFQQLLKDEGVEQVATDGQFDPSLHEAIDTRDGENDKVLEVVEKGYTLHGKILRPARVIIGRTKKDE